MGCPPFAYVPARLKETGEVLVGGGLKAEGWGEEACDMDIAAKGLFELRYAIVV